MLLRLFGGVLALMLAFEKGNFTFSFIKPQNSFPLHFNLLSHIWGFIA